MLLSRQKSWIDTTRFFEVSGSLWVRIRIIMNFIFPAAAAAAAAVTIPNRRRGVGCIAVSYVFELKERLQSARKTMSSVNKKSQQFEVSRSSLL